MTVREKAGFVHVVEPGEADRAPLLLLHGTGGDERDLLPLGRALAPGATLVSPRGKVLEGAMPRFFRRLAEGVFDEDDLRLRTDELAAFVGQIRVEYGLAAPIALGFSNGANIAASLLMTHPGVLAGAILIRAMPPYAKPPAADLAATPVLLLNGALDPIVPEDAADRLASDLEKAGAELTRHMLPAGHALSQTDLTIAREWLSKR